MSLCSICISTPEDSNAACLFKQVPSPDVQYFTAQQLILPKLNANQHSRTDEWRISLTKKIFAV
jgi:hypothetical protein